MKVAQAQATSNTDAQQAARPVSDDIFRRDAETQQSANEISTTERRILRK